MFGYIYQFSILVENFIISRHKLFYVIIKEYGDGQDEFAVVGGVHGDEPMTAKVIEDLIEDFKNAKFEPKKKIKLLIANEKALDQGVRYTDTDLNRSFPGDPNSDLYEERLASDIFEELKDTKAILSIHSSQSVPPAFAIASNTKSETNLKTIRSLPVQHVVDTSNLRKTTMDANIKNTVTIEAGKQGHPAVKRVGYECSVEFLKTHNIIKGNPEFTEKSYIIAKKELQKSKGTPKVYYDNFEKIPKGEVIAEDDRICHISEDDNTTPILMSEYGYEDIFGLVGYYNGKIVSNDLE